MTMSFDPKSFIDKQRVAIRRVIAEEEAMVAQFTWQDLQDSTGCTKQQLLLSSKEVHVTAHDLGCQQMQVVIGSQWLHGCGMVILMTSC